MVEKIINGKQTSTRAFESLYSFESHFTDINGHTLHYLDEGKGRPVVMVHGNPTWSFYYRTLVKTLSTDFRTIVPDHIGCGFSDKPDARSYAYTLNSRVNDLDTLIQRLVPGQKINLVLHDWGGMIGLAWAVDHLDQVDKIVITNTAGFLLPEGTSLPLRLWLIKYLNVFAVPAVLGLNLFARGALYLASRKGLNKQVKKGLVAPYNSWKNRIATLKFVQDIPISKKDQSYDRVLYVDQSLKQLNESRLLFLWGAKDFVFDLSFLNEFRTRFPGAATHVFHDAGHYLFEDKPDETAHLVEKFLNR